MWNEFTHGFYAAIFAVFYAKPMSLKCKGESFFSFYTHVYTPCGESRGTGRYCVNKRVKREYLITYIYQSLSQMAPLCKLCVNPAKNPSPAIRANSSMILTRAAE